MQQLSIFLAKQVHFHLASRLNKFRVKKRNRKVSKELENGQPEGRRDRIRLASGNRKWIPAETGISKTGGKPRTGRVRGNESNRSTGSGLAPVHKE